MNFLEKKNLLSILVILFIVEINYTQESDINVNEFSDFNNALKLYKNKSYAAAQETFKKVINLNKTNSSLQSDASYFDAMCATLATIFPRTSPAANRTKSCHKEQNLCHTARSGILP